jgi:diketogulonate reductase-like aldo/keto reductase
MTAPPIQRQLPSDETVAALGQGTWHIGDERRTRAVEIAALRRGLELGLTLVDTAEMYGDGRSEELVGEAIAGRRDQVFLVSKVYPHNASRRSMPKSCERACGGCRSTPSTCTCCTGPAACRWRRRWKRSRRLQRAGKIRHWGVSNFDLDGMQELWDTPGGNAAQVNQVLYHLGERGIEWDLLPWLRERRVPVMAYSPFDEGRLLRHPKLVAFAGRHGMTPAQVALAWLLAQDGVIAIPKSGSPERVEANARRCRDH